MSSTEISNHITYIYIIRTFLYLSFVSGRMLSSSNFFQVGRTERTMKCKWTILIPNILFMLATGKFYFSVSVTIVSSFPGSLYSESLIPLPLHAFPLHQCFFYMTFCFLTAPFLCFFAILPLLSFPCLFYFSQSLFIETESQRRIKKNEKNCSQGHQEQPRNICF